MTLIGFLNISQQVGELSTHIPSVRERMRYSPHEALTFDTFQRDVFEGRSGVEDVKELATDEDLHHEMAHDLPLLTGNMIWSDNLTPPHELSPKIFLTL